MHYKHRLYLRTPFSETQPIDTGMNIGIFETEHFEGAYPVIRLFDTPANKIVIATNEETYIQFKALLHSATERYHWVIQKKNQSYVSFFRELLAAAKTYKLDLFYFNTISKHHLLYAILIRLLPAMRVVMTVHDINCLVKSSPGGTPRSFIQHLGKKMLVSSVPELNVVSDTMIPYLKEQLPLKKIHNIPGAVFESRIQQKPIDQRIRIAIPGSIDQRRRDYYQVFDLANIVETMELPVDLILLGGPSDDYGNDVVNKARAFEGQHTQLKFYKEKVVVQEEFDLQLDAADFIFIPSVVHTKICGEIPETYGITKSSGNIFDVIKHAKPFIAPENLTIPHQLRNSCFMYRSVKQIADFLKQVKKDPGLYSSFQLNAIRNSELFTIDRIREKNPSLFKIQPTSSR